MVKIKAYQKNSFVDLDNCMVQLMDYIIKIDPLHLCRRAPKYSPQYAKNLLKKVKDNKGTIFLAYENTNITGCIVGIVEKQSKADLLENKPMKVGRILELVVLDQYRGQGIGQMLMKKMEKCLKDKKCKYIRVDVFAPNKNARGFYRKFHYHERALDLLKVIN